jgi:hypothetical protein
MQTITLTTLALGLLASCLGILIWWAASTTLDTEATEIGRRAATLGRRFGTTGLLLWAGGTHSAGHGLTLLLIAATATAVASHLTKTTLTPGPV